MRHRHRCIASYRNCITSSGIQSHRMRISSSEEGHRLVSGVERVPPVTATDHVHNICVNNPLEHVIHYYATWILILILLLLLLFSFVVTTIATVDQYHHHLSMSTAPSCDYISIIANRTISLVQTHIPATVVRGLLRPRQPLHSPIVCL